MTDFFYTTLIFLFTLGILVVLHEWGHYIVAKLVGIWVEKFSIGFGPKIIGFQKNGTDYRIAPIPLGGYVKLYGQDPYEEADRDEIKADLIAKDPQSFASKTYWQRMAVVLAGPAINIAFCILLLPLTFMLGKKELVIEQSPPVVIGVEKNSVAEQIGLQVQDLILSYNGDPVSDWATLLFKTTSYAGKPSVIEFKRGDHILKKEFVMGSQNFDGKEVGILGVEPHPFIIDKPIIGQINPDSQAEKAGLEVGDEIIAINNLPISRWSILVETIQTEAQKTNGKVALTVIRQEQTLTVEAQAVYETSSGRWLLGMLQKFPDDLYMTKRHGFVESWSMGLKEFQSLNSKLFETLGGLFSGKISAKNLGGPLEIASATSQAAKRGLGEFIYFLAFMSLQLGIFNLVPIPVLDGGHAFIMTFEALIRRPLPHKFRLVILYVGVALVMMLMAYVLFNDLSRFLRLSTWLQKIGF